MQDEQTMLIHRAVDNVLRDIREGSGNRLYNVDTSRITITVKTQILPKVGMSAMASATVRMMAFSRVTEADNSTNGHSVPVLAAR